jgi:ribosomal protein L28
MLGMYSGSDIVLRAMGTDMGRFQNQGEVTQFLLKNRDQMREQRREWIASVLGNNMSQAQKIKANYERQFGMPLTVTQQQMREAARVREESVAARTLKSMDKDLQQQYQDVLQGSVPQAMLNAQMPLEQGAMYVWSNLPKR